MTSWHQIRSDRLHYGCGIWLFLTKIYLFMSIIKVTRPYKDDVNRVCWSHRIRCNSTECGFGIFYFEIFKWTFVIIKCKRKFLRENNRIIIIEICILDEKINKCINNVWKQRESMTFGLVVITRILRSIRPFLTYLEYISYFI